MKKAIASKHLLDPEGQAELEKAMVMMDFLKEAEKKNNWRKQ